MTSWRPNFEKNLLNTVRCEFDTFRVDTNLVLNLVEIFHELVTLLFHDLEILPHDLGGTVLGIDASVS